MTDTVTRSIYNKAIFHREQQMDRKVYDRARNVLPVTPEPGPGPEPEPTGDTYRLKSVSVVNGGSGFHQNDEIIIKKNATIDPEIDPDSPNSAFLVVSHVDGNGAITGLAVDWSGTFTTDMTGTSEGFVSPTDWALTSEYQTASLDNVVINMEFEKIIPVDDEEDEEDGNE